MLPWLNAQYGFFLHLSENLMKIDAGSHKSGHNQEHHHLKVLPNSILERIKNREEE